VGMSLREVDLNEPVELSGVRSVSAQTNAARMHRLFSGPRATQSFAGGGDSGCDSWS
jgi:hypothetical protein